VKHAAWIVTLLVACNGSSNNPDPKTGVDAANTAGTATAQASASGPAAPDFELPTLEGGHMSLAQHKGKVVLIDFWSTICDPCLREMPELVKLYQEKKDKGFVVLAIATDGPETAANVSSVAKAHNMIFPVLLDSETAVLDRYYPEGRLPFTAVVDRSGVMVLKRTGYQPGDVESQKLLVEAIDKALAAR
jgi:peroxiredoxin